MAMRCPRCHRASAAPAWRCGCGRALGVEQVRAVLRRGEINARIALALLLVVDAVAASGAVGAALAGFIVTAALSLTALILLTARAVQRVRVTRASLRQLARLDAALPRAVVHRR